MDWKRSDDPEFADTPQFECGECGDEFWSLTGKELHYNDEHAPEVPGRNPRQL